MKNLETAFLISTLFTSSAFAGGISGGGGRSVVCRDSKTGAITSAQLLDLYEGTVQYGYTIKSSTAPKDAQLNIALELISAGRDTDYKNGLTGFSNLVSQEMRLLPDGTGLQPIDDSYEVIIPKDCKVEQLANFMDDRNLLLVDGSIWAALSETNKAALITHEALYKYLRLFGETNSIRTRQAVAFAFSGGTFQPNKVGIPADAWTCDAKDGSIFWAYNNVSGNLIFQFDFLNDKPVLSLSTYTHNGNRLLSNLLNWTWDLEWGYVESNLGETAQAVEITPPSDPKTFSGTMGAVTPPNKPTTEFTCSHP